MILSRGGFSSGERFFFLAVKGGRCRDGLGYSESRSDFRGDNERLINNLFINKRELSYI